MADADISAVIKKQLASVRKPGDELNPQPSISPVALPGVAPHASPEMSRMLSEGRPFTPAEQTAEDEVYRKGIPMLAANVASEGAASLPLLARLGITGATAGATAGAIGGNVPESALMGAGGELGSAGLSKVGELGSSLASKSLARILRLTPKSVAFGREPAEEVLREGIAGGSLEKLVPKIGEASKQVTAQLNDVLKNAPGTVNIENASLDVANSLPGAMGNRFLKVVDDAAMKLGFRSNQLSSLSNAEANALKQEVARQARFVEGDARASVANAAKVFGGRIKDSLIRNAPEAEPLLQSSANLTEASKAGDYALRAEKVGQGKSGLSSFDVKRPSTYLRPLTDTVTGAKLLFKAAQALQESGVSASDALRSAFYLIYPGSQDQ